MRPVVFLESDPRLRDEMKAAEDAFAPIRADLDRAGVTGVRDMSELLSSPKGDRRATPVLLKWMPLSEHVGVLAELLQTLGRPWVGRAPFEPLVEFYDHGHRDKWADSEWLSNYILFSAGLSIGRRATQRDVEVLLERLTPDRPIADDGCRIGIVLGLGRMAQSRDRVVPVLIHLLDEQRLEGPAVHALGQLRAVIARSRLEAFVAGADVSLRQQARTALRKIDATPRPSRLRAV